LEFGAPTALVAREIYKTRGGSEFYSARPQPADPRAQEPGRFLSAGKNASTRADIGFDAEIGRPGAQFVRSEFAEQIPPTFRFVDISVREIFDRLAVGQVQPAPARHEKFATNRSLRVANRHGRASGSGDFRRAQPGGATADDEDRVKVHHLM
jgi:hypothetical protein